MLNRLEAEKDSLAPFCGCAVGRNVRKSNAVSGNSTGMAAKEQLPKYCSSQLQRYLSTCMVTPLCSADLFQDQWKKKKRCVCINEITWLYTNFTVFYVEKFCKEAYVWFLSGLQFEYIPLGRILFSLLSSVRAFTAEMDCTLQPFMPVQSFLHCQNRGS